MDLSRYARKFIHASELPWREQYRAVSRDLRRGPRWAAWSLATAEGRDGFDAAAQAEHAEDELLRLMRLDGQTQLPEDLLLLTDKVTMAASIECRVPFLDHRLAELAAADSGTPRKLRGGDLKHLLKRALTGIVPDEILYRGKRGFGAPMGAWLKSDLQAAAQRRARSRRGRVARAA